jgi:hypothetical protein
LTPSKPSWHPTYQFPFQTWHPTSKRKKPIHPALTFSQMSKSYFTSVTTVGGYSWENWTQRDLTKFGKMPVTIYVAKTDLAGVDINRVANQYLNKGNTPVSYTEVDGDTPRLESLYNSKLLAMMEQL